MLYAYTLLYVPSVTAALEFYQEAFDFEVHFLHESKDYAEMKTGQTKIGFVHHDLARSNGLDYQRSCLTERPFGLELGLVSENVQEAYDKAIEAGCTKVKGPEDTPWGQTISYVRDLNGILVEICSSMD